MSDILDYQFGAMQETNTAVQQRLSEFSNTLEQFTTTYTTLAQQWGGTAAEGATAVAKQLGSFGDEVRETVQQFLSALQQHLEDSQKTEQTNTGLFS
ncbi:hypothetical protein [Rugosimonospora africana]|uniref:ESAT-6-like protein n=1 Tax=Rugosimonospora africana TaxID=556532 RepID=A0A8J3R2G2_9ACTN|nr:hypothetical protein [Rugosimonospora africana]GIH21031.1 hypothetical protein Raf01_92030 [Rugosimonospora africana]